MAGAYSRHVAHPTFKTLFLSSEDSEELAIPFFEENKATKNMDIDSFNNLLKAFTVGCQLATHYLPTTTHGPEKDRFLHKLANEELTTEMLTLYDVDFPEDVPSLADAEDFLLGLLPSLKVLRTKKAVKGSIRSHDDITADTEDDLRQKLHLAAKKVKRDLETFCDWFQEQTASLTEHERRAKAWESKRRDAAKQVILSIVEKSLAVSKSALASLASEAAEKARSLHEDWGLRSCFIDCFVLLPTEDRRWQQTATNNNNNKQSQATLTHERGRPPRSSWRPGAQPRKGWGAQPRPVQ